jgi:hypothetical protein
MKTICKTIIIPVLMFFYTNGLQAQTTQTKLNQVELMKQFVGTWKAEMVRDTTWIMEYKSFGNGMEFYLTAETKGTIIFELKTLMGYDKYRDKLIEFGIVKSSPEIKHYEGWFTSANKCEEVLLEDIPNSEKSVLIWKYEFKSPDLLIETDIKNDKIIGTFTFHRVKK